MKYIESQLQVACVRWFRYAYPKYSKLLFSIPNGGKRGIVTASIMKAEGTVAGCADLFLSVPKIIFSATHYHGMYIEMKSDKGKLSEAQEDFKLYVEKYNYKYIVCRSFDEFEKTINEYLK